MTKQNSTPNLLLKFNNLIARLENWLLILIVLLMVVFSFLQVVLRNVFSEGILAGDIILRHMVLWVGFIGASLATREERHITIDVFSRFLKGRLKLFVAILINLFSAAIALLLAQASYTFVMQEKEFETILFNNVPAWYFQIIIPIGFILITLRFVIISIDKIVGLFKTEGAQV